MRKTKVGVVIMRAQGYHDQHHNHILRAAAENDTVVIVFGSINARVSMKNPFSFEQRVRMLASNTLADERLNGKNLKAIGVRNHPDNFAWRDSVVEGVHKIAGDDIDVTLYGSDKDSSTFYLALFPQWKHSLTEVAVKVDATEIRELYFKGHQTVHYLRDHPRVSKHTLAAMMEFRFNASLQDEYDYYKAEGEKFAAYPYRDSLNVACADAVIKVGSKVLMIRRGKVPGLRCPALPGGHKHEFETFLEACMRELNEEAHINVSKQDLMDHWVGDLMFDEPNRSEGPLTRMTRAFLFDLTDMFEEGQYPEVYADDDAMETLWVEIEELFTMDNVYDDHAKIVWELVTTFCDDF